MSPGAVLERFSLCRAPRAQACDHDPRHRIKTGQYCLLHRPEHGAASRFCPWCSRQLLLDLCAQVRALRLARQPVGEDHASTWLGQLESLRASTPRGCACAQPIRAGSRYLAWCLAPETTLDFCARCAPAVLEELETGLAGLAASVLLKMLF